MQIYLFIYLLATQIHKPFVPLTNNKTYDIYSIYPIFIVTKS